MGFSHVCIAPPFVPAPDGDIFITADHESLHPALGWRSGADLGISQMVRMADQSGLRLILDVSVNQVASAALVRQLNPEWFSTGFCGGTPDPHRVPPRLGAAVARFEHGAVAEELSAWWADRLVRLVRAGVVGFCCRDAERVPGTVWRRLWGQVRAVMPDCLLLAWTAGVDRAAIGRLEGAGFDLTVGSFAWWDGRATWLVEEIDTLRRIGPAIGTPEPSFTDRLATRLFAGADIASAYRHALRVSAAAAAGLFVPMGFEYATRRAFDPARATPDDLHQARAEAPVELGSDILEANRLVDSLAKFGRDGGLRQLTASSDPATALLRFDAVDPRDATRAAVVFINPNMTTPAPTSVDPLALPPEAGIAFRGPLPIGETREPESSLRPGEVRILCYERNADVLVNENIATVARAAMSETRIAIEAVTPAVPDGDFAVKRVVGESVTVSADIFADGHEKLVAVLLWRPADEQTWQQVSMQITNNDRWEAKFTPQRVGLHYYTIEAWWDVWGTFCHDLDVKHHAGLSVLLEIEEGRHLLAAARDRSTGNDRQTVESRLRRLENAAEPERIDLLLADETAEMMQRLTERPFLAHHRPALRLNADRPQAAFASWYELFPRSCTSDPARHGTFNDVINRLPAIRAMGFDVLYFPPIHPIGHTNRKGRNNALHAAPEDLGSPYAIGSEDGGHDAVHPQLGTLADFRRLLGAARRNGLEIALDFAIQCSPDHPWLRKHPDWFRWRPDGSMRYAENPPKKYEDIVNPDFYTDAAMPALWHALRDVVQFWVDNGVRIFRVDNPHTKPLPFWSWLIADIHARHPDVIFLAEAFTRPKMMYRLAKVGFTQSYTYFTWRNSKQEITEYLTELNSVPVRDFFRPNFFVNTPDINPYFLQTSGRPGFLIRTALATMLSGLWGMYSGFEICEAAPLPEREEYLDAEKYEIRIRDYGAPSNIVGEITALNRIRRAHSALHTHLGIRFYNAFNDQIMVFGKRAPDHREMILVAVSFDPHHVQEADFEIPLWEFGLPDWEALDAVDLMRNHRFTWHGKMQHIRLDPADLPFAIWQITSSGVPT